MITELKETYITAYNADGGDARRSVHGKVVFEVDLGNSEGRCYCTIPGGCERQVRRNQSSSMVLVPRHCSQRIERSIMLFE